MRRKPGIGIGRCESPLEIAMAEVLMRLSRFVPRKRRDHAWELGVWDGWALCLLAQPEIGPYRPDLAIVSYHQRDWGDGNFPFVILIEVDGHDFHERTKEQARHDKQRDRFFTRHGASTFRFTGSEVYRNPNSCAQEVFEYALRVQDDNLNEKFEAWLNTRAQQSGKRTQ